MVNAVASARRGNKRSGPAKRPELFRDFGELSTTSSRVVNSTPGGSDFRADQSPAAGPLDTPISTKRDFVVQLQS